MLSERQTQQISDEKSEAMEKFEEGLRADLLLFGHAGYSVNHGIVSRSSHQLNFNDICEEMEIDDTQEKINVYALFSTLHFEPHSLSALDTGRAGMINTCVDLVIDRICKEKFK